MRPFPLPHRRAGFTLVELMVVFAIMTVAIGMYAQTMAATVRMDPVSEETAIAAEAARSKLEEMRGFDFREIFRRFNASSADDPGGPGTAPGAVFDVPGLRPPPGLAHVGSIVFPCLGSQVREDYQNPQWGMPRDLNNDGIIDPLDHTADCIVLPVKVHLEWASQCGRQGKRTFEIHSMFAQL